MGTPDKKYIQVYTGNGKGKTTAAIGLACRAAGFGLKTYFAQFMKDFSYSELNSLNFLSEWITIDQFGNDDFVFKKEKPSSDLINSINEALNNIEKIMVDREYDIIVLDEISVSIYFGLIEKERVLKFINNKPENIELIITGRYCPEEIIKKADLVTNMEEVKHYYQLGVTSRKGFES